MKKRLISLLIVLTMLVGMIPLCTLNALAEGDLQCANYVDGEFSPLTVPDKRFTVSSGDIQWGTGWYVVTDSFLMLEDIYVIGETHLVLTSACYVSVESIEIAGTFASLTVHNQIGGDGRLTVSGGISGEGKLISYDAYVVLDADNGPAVDCDTVTVCGGTFAANGDGDVGIKAGTLTLGGGTALIFGDNGADAIEAGHVFAAPRKNFGVIVKDGSGTPLEGSPFPENTEITRLIGGLGMVETADHEHILAEDFTDLGNGRHGRACTVCRGFGDLAEHTYEDDFTDLGDGRHGRACTVCGSFGDCAAHTSGSDYLCTVCQGEDIAHAVLDAKAAIDAVKTADNGTVAKEYGEELDSAETLENISDILTEALAAMDAVHRYTGEPLITEDTHSYQCATCEKYGPAEAHTYVDYVCTGCGHENMRAARADANKAIDEAWSWDNAEIAAYALADLAQASTLLQIKQVLDNALRQMNAVHRYTGDCRDNGDGTHSRRCVNENCERFGPAQEHTFVSFVCACGVEDLTSAVAYAKAEIEAVRMTDNVSVAAEYFLLLDGAETVDEVNAILAEALTAMEAVHQYLGEYFINDGTTHSRRCTECGKLGPAEAHTFVHYVCTSCGAEDVPSAVQDAKAAVDAAETSDNGTIAADYRALLDGAASLDEVEVTLAQALAAMESVHDYSGPVRDNHDGTDGYPVMPYYVDSMLEDQYEILANQLREQEDGFAFSAPTGSNVSLYGRSMLFEHALALNYYVRVLDGEAPTVTCDNGKYTLSVEHVNDDLYRVTVGNIFITDFADTITVRVNDAAISGSIEDLCAAAMKAHPGDDAAARAYVSLKMYAGYARIVRDLQAQ